MLLNFTLTQSHLQPKFIKIHHSNHIRDIFKIFVLFCHIEPLPDLKHSTNTLKPETSQNNCFEFHVNGFKSQVSFHKNNF